jgi:hypothetical protein
MADKILLSREDAANILKALANAILNCERVEQLRISTALGWDDVPISELEFCYKSVKPNGLVNVEIDVAYWLKKDNDKDHC